MKQYHKTLKVLTGPDWLLGKFYGIKNQKGTSVIKPVIDPDDRPIIGLQVLDDPEFNFMEGLEFEDPRNPSDKRLIRDWLELIPYCYDDEIT